MLLFLFSIKKIKVFGSYFKKWVKYNFVIDRTLIKYIFFIFLFLEHKMVLKKKIKQP